MRLGPAVFLATEDLVDRVVDVVHGGGAVECERDADAGEVVSERQRLQSLDGGELL